jgi:hypothetical protein
VTFKVGGTIQQWEALIPTVVLNILVLLFMGKLLSLSRRIPPATMVLSYVGCYFLFAIATVGLSLLTSAFDRPNSPGFFVISILAVATGPPLMLLGSGIFRKSARASAFAE